MKEIELTKESAPVYARKHYQNPQEYHGNEFYDDMQIFFYVKKLLTRYKKGESVKHQLTLNHIITLNNLFRPAATRKLLRFYIPEECHPALNSFFAYLSILPDDEVDVKLDRKILKFLKDL